MSSPNSCPTCLESICPYGVETMTIRNAPTTTELACTPQPNCLTSVSVCSTRKWTYATTASASVPRTDCFYISYVCAPSI